MMNNIFFRPIRRGCVCFSIIFLYIIDFISMFFKFIFTKNVEVWRIEIWKSSSLITICLMRFSIFIIKFNMIFNLFMETLPSLIKQFIISALLSLSKSSFQILSNLFLYPTTEVNDIPIKMHIAMILPMSIFLFIFSHSILL